jgi:hypothetical protein
VQWKHLLVEDAMWKEVEHLPQQFLSINLEDKVSSREGEC